MKFYNNKEMEFCWVQQKKKIIANKIRVIREDGIEILESIFAFRASVHRIIQNKW